MISWGPMKEKIEKIKRHAREAPVSSDDGAEVQGLSDALSVLQMREREFHQQLEETNRTVERERGRAEVKLLTSLWLKPTILTIDDDYYYVLHGSVYII